MTLWT